MKQPQWQLDVDPAGGGPMMVTPTRTDAPGRALAGLGQGIASVGRYLTEEAKQAAEYTKRLDESRKVSEFGTGAVRDYNQLKQDLASEPNPDAWQPKFDAMREQVRTRLDTITDPDARIRAETWLNQEEAVWDADIRTGAMQTSVKQSSDHLKVLLDDAVERRSIDQVQLYADMLVDRQIPGFTEQWRSDLVAQVEPVIERELVKDRVTAETLAQPTYGDQVKYLRSLSKPGGMNDQEWVEFRDQLSSKLDVDRAAAAQAQAAHEAQVERNNDAVVAAAHQGKLDLTTLWDRVENDEVDGTVAGEAQKIAIAPPTQNDPGTFARLMEIQDAVERGARPAKDLRTYAEENASKLTAARYESAIQIAANPFATQNQAVNDAVQYMRGQLLTVADEKTFAELAATLSGEASATADEKHKRELALVDLGNRELEEWLAKNPDATRAETLRRGREITALLKARSVEVQDMMVEQWRAGRPRTEPIWNALAGEGAGAAPTPGPNGALRAQGGASTEGTEATETPAAPAAPAGLEAVWGTMTPEERASAMRMLARGVTAAEIVEALQ
jgi:hypothetical protein